MANQWIKNAGVKPNFEFVDVRFDNCKSDDSALSEKSMDDVSPDELIWYVDIDGGSEITHYREAKRA